MCNRNIWTTKKDDQRTLLAFEMRCYSNVVVKQAVRWQDRRTNVEFRRTVQRDQTVIYCIYAYNTQQEATAAGTHLQNARWSLLTTVMLEIVKGQDDLIFEAARRRICHSPLYLRRPCQVWRRSTYPLLSYSVLLLIPDVTHLTYDRMHLTVDHLTLNICNI